MEPTSTNLQDIFAAGSVQTLKKVKKTGTTSNNL